jgi:hypothetical protein
MNKFLRAVVLLACVTPIICTKNWAQVSLSTSPYSQDFNGLSNGTDNTPVSTPVPPNGWAFLETGTSANTSYRPHNGGGNSGDTYSFGATSSTERAFGQIRSGSLISVLGGNFQNNTGSLLGSVTIDYIGEQWRLGTTGRSDKIDFQYSLDATSLSTGTWIDVNELDFTGPISAGTVGALDGNSSTNRISLSFTITSLNIANGSSFWIRWNDIDASGSDDGLAIDDFQLSFSTSDVTPPTFTPSYPKTSSPSSSGFDLVTNLNETGKTYFVILSNNAAAPTSTQVKNGQDATGASLSAGLFGAINVTSASSDFSSTISGLASATDYDVYVVAEDLALNIQISPVKLDVLTNTAGDIAPPNFLSTYPNARVSSTSLVVLTSLDEQGKTFFVVLPSGATAPSSVQVSLGLDTNGSTVILSGTINVTSPSIEFSSLVVNGLIPSTGYDVYVVASDNVPNLQTSPAKISVTTSPQFVETFNVCDGTASFTQYSVTGAQVWGCTDFGRASTKGIRMNGFSGGAVANEDWLISPLVNLGSNASLSFYSQFSFSGNGLQLKISTNYSGSGDPNTATWTDLNGNFPTVAVSSSSTSLSDWTLSKEDLSAYASQNVYVAFVYTSTSTAAARWTLDEISFNSATASYLQVSPSSLLFTAGGSTKSYSLNGFNLSNDVILTAPANFTLSKDNTVFSSSISYSASEVNSPQTVYVKFDVAPGSTSTFTGAITNTSTGVATKSISVIGTDKSQTLDIATYNLEFFGTDVKNTSGVEFGPIDDALQISNVTSVMQTISADIYGLEEVADDNAFNTLVSNLPGYNGILSNRWSYSFDPPDPNFPPQKVGFVYNTSTVQLVNSRVMFAKLYDDVRAGNTSLLPGYPATGGNTPANFWSSGRLPFMVTFDVTLNGATKRIRVIDIHAKSGSAQADYDRRKYDVKVLHDSLVANYANDKIILLGDFNDDVDVSIGAPTNPESTYKVFVDNTANFNTLTYAISQAGAFSFPSSNSFLDHIITSNELTNSYVANSITVEDARAYIPNYVNTTSDHLPVSARFTIIPPPTVNLSVSANAGTEASTTVITVTAISSAPVEGDQTINVNVTGSGITTDDYLLSNSIITIANGTSSGSVTFTIVNDVIVECAETATLAISSPSIDIVLGATTTQAVTIADDDNKATLTVSAAGIGYEATTTAITVTATASAAVTGNQTVDLLVAGTGVTASDYTLNNTTITILNGATTGTTIFTVANDTELEGTEYPTITLSNPSSCLALGTTTKRDLIIFDNDFPTAPVGNQEIQLSFVSSYLNVGSSPGNSAEISAYDPTSKRLFIVNSLGKKLNIVDFSNPVSMSNIATIDISIYGGINSVAVKNGIVAVAIEGTITTDNGSVVFFDKDGTFLKQVTVGAMPDMITFSPNRNFVLTANEGEPNDAYTIDPEGSVSVIDISGGVTNLTQSNVITANFNAFDSQLAALRAHGVRIYGLGATVSKDLEPEYIAFSSDGNTAYVTLQENNAIGVLDMATKTITAIRPLGLKDHSLLKNGLDASDQSGVVNISNLPVKGMYQPDAIAGFAVDGTNYLITANEGDSRAYTGFNEEVRVSASTYVLDPTVFPNAALLKSNNVLGRLQLTNKTGDTDGDGDFDEIHALGARSFSIWKPTTTGLDQVFDSGDQLERITAADATYGSIFNANNSLVAPARKDRSDNKGPEPEGVTVATINDKIYAFVTLERIGGVMVYNVTDPTNPVFVQYSNSRSTTAATGDFGPEGIFFISAKDSPSGVPLVVLSNEISSTISVYSVGGEPLPAAPSSLTVAASSTQVAAAIAWTDNATNETGFEIQRSLNPGTGFISINTVLSNTTTYIDNTVSVGSTYFYKVKAFNDFGFSTESNTESITINKVDQTITFNALPAKTFGDVSFALSATSTSGLPVSFGSSDATIASISGNTVTILKAGAVNITASQAGDASFNAATNIVQSLTINKANQVITFAAIPDKLLGDATFTVTATSTFGLAVTLTPNSKISIAGNQVTIVSAGKASITASQTGNENYNAATSVVRDFCIKPAKPTVNVSLVGSTATLTSSAASGNQWFLNNVVIPSATNSTYNATTAGTYKVQVTIDNCVGDFSNDTPVVITGDLPTFSSSVAVYPNPADDRLMIVGLEEEARECIVVDLLGRNTTLSLTKQKGGHELSVENFSSGVYLIRVQQSNAVQQIRFVKK